MKNPKFVPLTGDPVYDHLSKETTPGNTILGARIFERKVCTPKQARKVIRFEVENESTGKKLYYDFNYNKVFRELEK